MRELKKMSLKTIENALTRSEMRSIMAGSGSSGESYSCSSDADCKKICDRQEAYCANYASSPKTCLRCCY